MEVKKNPSADLNRDRGLFFVIGLTLVLFLTWRALEYKTYPKDEILEEMAVVTDDLKEDVPVTEVLNTQPPPPPPAAPEVIEIVEDTEEIEETIIESTETSQDAIVDDIIIDVDDVVVGEEEEEISIPFAVIENVPVFPGCESLVTNDQKKKCFEQKMQEHIRKEFKYPDVALELGIMGKVYVQFNIDSDGKVKGIRTRGPDKMLEAEAERIVAALPQMIPGKQRGRPVRVPYSIPVTFKIQ